MSTDAAVDFSARTAEVGLMLQSGDIAGAVRLSGEMLAHADNNLRVAYNNKLPLEESADQFVEAAILHVHSLRLAKAAGDAFLCAVGALLTLEVYKQYPKIEAVRKLRLYDYAIRSAIDSFESAEDLDEDHRGYILSFLASLLYYNYTQAVAAGEQSDFMTDVYRFLCAIKDSGAIQSPKIRLGEAEVDPAEPGPVLIDVMSRGAATIRPTFATEI